MKMKAPGRASSMKEKSSPPISGAVSVSTLSAPATCPATPAANCGLARRGFGHRIFALVGGLGDRAVELRRRLGHFHDAALDEVAHLRASSDAGGALQVRRLRDHVERPRRHGTCRSR